MADQTLEAFGQPNKGLSWGELIVDNIIGLDNEYESFGEKLGKAINEDEIKFLKDAAVGVYEGTKEFVQAPVETTKQVVSEIKDSVTRLGSEDLNTRLQRMYNVTYEQATDEQVNQAREAVLGDALTALELVPAAKGVTAVAKAGIAAVPGGLKADVVGQTKAMLSGDREFLSATPTNRATTQSLSAGFTGQNPPTYKKRDTLLSQQEDFELDFDKDGVIKPKGIPSEKTRLRKDNIMRFREPIAEFAKTVTIPKKGLLGSEFLKMIKKNESIADSSLQPQIIDPKKRYTREELLEAIGLQDQYPGPNVFESNAYINNTMGGEMYAGYQRQGKDAKFLDIEEELGYFEIPIVSNVPSGFEGTGKNFKANSQHFEAGTIAHVRGSIVQPHDLETTAWWPITNTSASLKNYESIIEGKPFLLVEEIQSDLLQKGYAKPSSLSDAAFNKGIEEWSRNNTVSFQEMFGNISKDIKNIFEELDEANIVRPDFVDGFGEKDKFQRKVADRGYILSNELEEVLDKLNLTEEFIEPSITDLTRSGMNRDLPIVDVDTGAFFTEKEFTEKFKKEKYLSPREKTQKFFDKSRELLANKKIDKEINFNDFQNLYASYKTNQFRLSRGGYHDDIGLPPITKNKQAVEESLKTFIAKAAQSGVDKIVIPPAERIAYARGRDIDFNNKGDRFYRTYVSDLDKALKDLEKNYPVKVHRDVELPYERKERMIDETEATANFYEVATDFIRQNLIEHEGISVPQDIDLEALNRAADKERFLSPLSAEEDAAFRTFAKHNQISLDEAGDAFDNWFDGQLRHLQGIDGFDEIQESLSTQISNKGIILDVSELVDEYKVEEPRQFAEGGSIRPKLRPGSDRRISPKPQLRPDPERQYGLAEVEARADFDPAMHWNPIARLGFTGFSSDKTGKGNELYPPAFYFPSEMSKKRAIERAIANEIPYDKALTVEPDDIYIAPELANKRVWTHEMTHRGFDRIIEGINNHPEGPSAGIKEFKDKYGDDTFRLLTARTSKSHEGIVEMFDDLEDSVLREAPEKEYLDDSSVDEIKRFQRTIKRKPEDRWQINQDRYRPYIKLMEAAQDMLTKAGEPPKSPDYEESILDKLRIKLGFAEGGAVGNMNQQMSFAFEDGGLRDDGMMRDPVSGNEVPPGSTAKEVRDDIPAQLSEGEYVVPADVVRYYGVKFFEDLRDNAKMGLQDMEARGRIGGEPVPAGGPQAGGDLTPEEMAVLQELGMAEGGVVNMYKQQQDLYSPPNPAIGNSMNMATGGTVPSYAPGGLQPAAQQTQDQIYAAGQQAQQAGFTGFPLGSTIFPTQTQIDQGQTTPAYYQQSEEEDITFQNIELINTEPPYDVVLATTEQMLRDYTDQGYVLNDGSFTPPVMGSDDGSPPPPTGESKPAYEDWLNSADFNSEAGIEKFVAGIEYDPSKSNLDMQTLGATMMGGPMAGIATAAGGALRGGGLQAISDLRAASLIAKAQGLDELAGRIDNQVADIIKDGPGILDFLDDIFATGKQKGNAWAKKNGFENIDAAIEAGVTPKPPVVKSKPPAVEPTPSDDDGGNPPPTITPSSGPSTTVGTTPSGASQPTATTGGGMTGSDTRPDDPRGEGQYGGQSTSGSISQTSGLSQSEIEKNRETGAALGYNKGGLMAKGKKKKKK
jgi:hypothetical protein